MSSQLNREHLFKDLQSLLASWGSHQSWRVEEVGEEVVEEVEEVEVEEVEVEVAVL